LVPRSAFNAPRYEGSDADERRLFYVAMTRARDWLSVSRHDRITKNRTAPSPYFTELSQLHTDPDSVYLPSIETKSAGDVPIEVTFSELSTFLECGVEYRLRNLIGFQPKLATELGYGKAVHHVLRTIAEHTRQNGKVPTQKEIDNLIESSFFLPTANKPAHKQLKEAARRLVTNYSTDYEQELHRVWETERPFELHLDGITVSGRADVILDREGGGTDQLAILDYKTSTKGTGLHDLQLQVYANAGRREGLDVRAAYVHDLKKGNPNPVDVSDAAVAASEQTVLKAAERLRKREYEPTTSKVKCRTCEVRSVCGSAKR
jgi:DNA helicase-2/ATP-dependent DNA helicase PcrA